MEINEKNKTELWSCPICFDINYPMISTNCGHSICKKCSVQIFFCAECRKAVDKYVPNWVLGNLLNLENNDKIEKKTVSIWDKWYQKHIQIIQVIESIILNRLKSRTTKHPGFGSYIIKISLSKFNKSINRILDIDSDNDESFIFQKIDLIKNNWKNTSEPCIILNTSFINEKFKIQIDLSDELKKITN
jgi:rRNA-processing protein FCF1